MHDQWQKLDELVIAWMQEQSDFQHKVCIVSKVPIMNMGC